jgi:hypothetical protein
MTHLSHIICEHTAKVNGGSHEGVEEACRTHIRYHSGSARRWAHPEQPRCLSSREAEYLS